MIAMRPPPSRLDRFQIVTTVLFVMLGVIILLRASLMVAAHHAVSPLAFLFGGALAAYGIYRLRLIMGVLERRDRGHKG
jgi:hypothetical protein